MIAAHLTASTNLRARDVYILSDDDDPGTRHAKQASGRLATVAREIRVVNLPGLPAMFRTSWRAAATPNS
jgi:hypothetical protein